MKFIAHRGYSKRFPENTLAAFEAVVSHRANGNFLIGIELDIQLTKDCRIPVVHDTSLRGRKICDMTMNEVKAENPNIPSLEETLALINHQTCLYLEIKEGQYEVLRFISELKRCFDVYQPERDIVLHSFSVPIMRKTIKATSDYRVQYGFLFDSIGQLEQLPPDILEKLHYLHPEDHVLLKNSDVIFQRGLSINVWTVNDMDTVRQFEEINEEGLIKAVMTDDIGLAEV